MQLKISTARSPNFKRASKTTTKELTAAEIYDKKYQSRLNRAKKFKENERIIKYIAWIDEVQKKLGLSDTVFCNRLGISRQTRRLWRRNSGVLPSERVYKKLVLLEKEANIPVIFKKVKVGIKIGVK